MAKRFDGKTVFITGASAGIGAALARVFAEQGANVAIAARRIDRLNALRAGLEAKGARVLALACDVTDRASIDAAVAATVSAFGGIDVAIANAGFGVSGVFADLTTADFRRQFDTNVFGLIDTVYAVLPYLEESRGRLGLVSSVMGYVGAPASSAYCSSKFAVCGLADSIYTELAARGVSVTCICPGLVESDFRMTDNKGAYHPDATDPAPAWLVMPADKAARIIAHGLHRRAPEIVVTLHGKLGVLIKRHFPRTTRFLIAMGRRRALKKAGRQR